MTYFLQGKYVFVGLRGVENAVLCADCTVLTRCPHVSTRLDQCLELLIRTNRLPEAAFLARTYLPSQVSRVVKLWRESLAKVNQKVSLLCLIFHQSLSKTLRSSGFFLTRPACICVNVITGSWVSSRPHRIRELVPRAEGSLCGRALPSRDMCGLHSTCHWLPSHHSEFHSLEVVVLCSHQNFTLTIF